MFNYQPPTSVVGASTNLAWDASTSSNVGGYILFYGQNSGNYTANVDVGKTTSYTVQGLQEGATYYFRLKAYDTTRTIQSAYSNEATLTVPVTPIVTADFTPSVTSGVENLMVNFTPKTTGTVTSWVWAFPGSSTPSVTNSTAQVVSVTYPTAGTYSVSLTAVSLSGSISKTYPNLITVTAPLPPPPPIVLPPPPPPVSVSSLVGLVAAYGFEEISGTTVADASGNGNHGTIKEAVSIPNGHSGKALKFDGVNDWITINDSPSLDISAGMTLEAWVYPTVSMNRTMTVIMKEQPGQQVYTLYANTDSNQPAVDPWINGGERLLAGGTLLPANQWRHLVGTYDGQNEILYVNGQQVAIKPQSGPILTSTGALRIGGDSIWSGEFFQGYIDEVRIYNRALTPAEVNYNQATAISVSNPPKFIMGNQTLEPWVGYNVQGKAQAFQTVPQKSGIVTAVQVYLDPSSTATALVAGVYKDNKGHPGALVAQGSLSTLKSGAWNSVPIPVASVTAAQPYWIAILGSKGQIGYLNRIGSATGRMESSSSNRLTTLPATWTGTAYQTNSAMSVFGLGY
ncbi:fibronectin type III domain-containing protein [Methylobacter sp. S3L5C]|nr:fibronectin type III domain-containing protein [Methylobacter sp. S3L5C]